MLLTIVSWCLALAQESQAGIMKGMSKQRDQCRQSRDQESRGPTAPAAAAERELLLFPEEQAALNMTDPAG